MRFARGPFRQNRLERFRRSFWMHLCEETGDQTEDAMHFSCSQRETKRPGSWSEIRPIRRTTVTGQTCVRATRMACRELSTITT